MLCVLYGIGRKVGNPSVSRQKLCCAAEGPDGVSLTKIMTHTRPEGNGHD